ncbi:polysaccharide deacetylase family protein [Acetivibrio mesophilus]|uniref:Deacetylase n=1 Tax=Acetivibrio mesophilus TaxID=2487273 RepID=A0A4Q0I796_9FIRM|nr:polysaccharide deacetylase family protein [Acetivibrio mesophilus]ODM25612.1 deacetylase [Clostridium sp. Bc-iso-3]RXE60198.1 deacetylase [Acetivibrio mesophilus]HHV29038.1 polysaccharide deacetylase family protein [Clostridium sp.]
MKFYVVKVNSILKYSLLASIILVVAAFAYFSREEVAAVFQQKREIPIYSVDYPEKKIALTFDCAWGSEDIPDILNTLREQDVKATFFIIGVWAEKNPDAVKMISDEGHDIANHSYSHYKMASLNNSAIKSEILKCDSALKKITGKDVDLFRPPYGDYNNDVVRIARELNHYTIQWDVDSLDWKPGITADEIKNRVLKNVGNGSIILFHNDTKHTAKILPEIITSLKEKGYGFIPVSKMIMRENFEIDYRGRQIKKQ